MPTTTTTNMATLDDHQDKDALISEPRKKIAKLETKVKTTKQIGKSMQKVCVYMTRVATDGRRKRGKGTTGVMELAEQPLRHAVFVQEKIWPKWKRMPENWIVFSTKQNTIVSGLFTTYST